MATMGPDTIKKACEALGFPTDDVLAASIWRTANVLIKSDAKEFYTQCGYVPFSGFPLTRSHKKSSMSNNEIVHERRNNPLCNLKEEQIFWFIISKQERE